MNRINNLINEFKKNYEIYLSNTIENNNFIKQLLVIVPDLELNGANKVLLELIPLLQNHNYTIWIISPGKGVFLSKYNDIGCNIIIRPTVYADDNFRFFLQSSFDLILLNTSSVHYYSLFFINTKTPVLWWFHESYEQLKTESGNMIHLSLLSNNFNILSVTQKVQKGIHALYGAPSIEFPMYVKDYSSNSINNSLENNKIIFFIPGAYTYIKGQDILIKSIINLPTEHLKKCKFIFAGYKLESQLDYYNMLKKTESLLPEIEIHDSLSNDEMNIMYQNCNCVIAPSRIDSTPTTIVEALMFSKLCLVSDGAGITYYLENNNSAIIFKNENTDDLLQKLIYVITNYNDTKNISACGRKIYETYFSKSSVKNNLNKILLKIKQ